MVFTNQLSGRVIYFAIWILHIAMSVSFCKLRGFHPWFCFDGDITWCPTFVSPFGLASLGSGFSGDLTGAPVGSCVSLVSFGGKC